MELRALGSCNGNRPWLGPGTKQGCGEPNRLLIRSARRHVFPRISCPVISIPDTQTALDEVVQSAWDEGLSIVDSPEKLAFVRQIPALAVNCKASRTPPFAAMTHLRQGGSAAERPVEGIGI